MVSLYLRNGALERQATGTLTLVLVSRLRLSRCLLLSRRGFLLRTTVGRSSVRCCGSGRVVLLVCTALQSLEADLGDSLVEGLALGGSDLQLLLGGLARAVTVLL